MRHPAYLLVGLLLLSTPAWAAKPAGKSAAQWVKEGERLYQAGRYHEAAEALLEAQKLAPHPRLIYNIARAYDQAGELMAALNYYQQYVGSSEGTDPVLLKRSALAIDRIRELIRQQEEERAVQEAERRRLSEEANRAQARAEAEAEAKRRAEAEAEARRRAVLDTEVRTYERSRTSAFVVGGVAVAGLATGATFGLLALGSKGEFAQAATLEDKQRLRGLTQQRALIADIGLGVGLAAAVTTVLLYPKGPAPGIAPRARLQIAPSGAGVEVRF